MMPAAVHPEKGAKTRRRPFAAGAAIAGLVLLAACSGAPSDGDIKAALERDLASSRSPLRFIELALGTRVTAVKQSRCVCEQEGDAWVCDVRVTLERMNPLTGGKEISEGDDKLRLTKSDGGWALAGQGAR